MKVSVIIPVWNMDRFLRVAIASIFDQQYQPIEVIVIDDGSTDKSAGIAQEFSDDIVYVRQEHQGLPGTRNKGVQTATSDLIAFLDADDIWRPGTLSRATQILREQPELDAVCGMTQIMMPAPDSMDFTKFVPYGESQYMPSVAAHVFRRRVFEIAGMFNAEQQHADDIDFMARVKEAGVRIERHEHVVLEYRRHDKNMTNDMKLDRKYLVAAIKQAMDRKRRLAS